MIQTGSEVVERCGRRREMRGWEGWGEVVRSASGMEVDKEARGK